jgi:hypothetical protein
MATISPRRVRRARRHVPVWVHVLLTGCEGLSVLLLPLPVPVHIALLVAVHVAIAAAVRA